MKKEYWFLLLTQILYVIIALLSALILWTFLPKVSKVIFEIGPVRASGAFGGFAFLLWFLHKKWPIEEVKKSIKSVHAGIILTPSKKEEYNELFGGFEKCDFYAFNPPFRLEREPGDHLFEEALATHAKRYVKGGVISHYLFFDDESYRRAMSFFKHLEAYVGKELTDKVKIAKIKNPAKVPGYTFFIGHKRQGKRPFCIFYPSVVMRKGLPEVVIYIEGAKDFLGILRSHFETNWDQAIQNNAHTK